MHGFPMIEHDSYYKNQSHLTFEERILTNYDIHQPLIRRLDDLSFGELLAGRSVDIPIYDYTQHTRLREGLIVENLRMYLLQRNFSTGRQTSSGFNGHQSICGYCDDEHSVIIYFRIKRLIWRSVKPTNFRQYHRATIYICCKPMYHPVY